VTDMTDYYAALNDTWPAASFINCGPFTIRNGQGGGNRVSAATAHSAWTPADIEDAERIMRGENRSALFMVRQNEQSLDRELKARGYIQRDQTRLWVCPIEMLLDLDIPRVLVFDVWEPLNIQKEIWSEGGIGAERIAVMKRVTTPKTALLARRIDKPAGVAFAALSGDICMVHAVEIRPEHRREGMARWLMRGAARWAAQHGATQMSVLCTHENTSANALYSSLGMTPMGGYHYRSLPE